MRRTPTRARSKILSVTILCIVARLSSAQATRTIYVDPPVARTKNVTGFITNTTDATVTVKLYRNENGSLIEIDKVEYTSTDGRFGVVLRTDMRVTDEIEVQAKVDSATVGPVRASVGAPADAADWGRVRGLFSLGVIVSQDIDNSDPESIESTINNGELYFDFRVASTWRKLRRECSKSQKDSKPEERQTGDRSGEKSSTPPKTTPNPCVPTKTYKLKGRIERLETGFRLTTTPVVVQLARDEAGMTSTVESVASRRAISVDGNYSISWPRLAWKHDDKDQVLALGVFANTEFRQLIDQDPTGQTLLSAQAGSRFFPGFAVGIRSAHYAMPESFDEGAELLSHIDFGVGWLSYMNRDTDMDGPNVRTPPRLYFSGRLRVPSLPLELGAEGNWALRKEGGMATFNDVRVFFATTFDIGQVLAAVAGRSSS